ncbi:adenylate/guanylate cyclase domain-containing protein [bacterium]|nr:adenylate/guanylate cyclase domain-containing protein [bacterium]
MIKKLLRPSGYKISITITLIFILIYGYSFLGYGSGSILDLLDKQVIDFSMRSRGNTLENDEVAIVAIDTKAIDNFGQWPWKRDVMARLLHELETFYEIKVMGYDVLFSEPDANDISSQYALDLFYTLAAKENRNTPEIIHGLRQIRTRISAEVNNDAKFGAELSKWNNVVLGYFFFLSASLEQIKHLTVKKLDESAALIENSEITIIQGAEHLEWLPIPEGRAVEANIRELNYRNALNGYFNVVPDIEDGTIRRIPMVIKYRDMYFPSLDLQIVRRYLGNDPIRMVVNEGGIEGFALGKKWIQTASDGTVMINFRGPAYTFPHYSVFDVINHKIAKEKLKDKIVILGATETGIYDLRTTPFGSAFPGVEVHANLIDNLLRDDYLYQSDFINFMSFLMILFSGLIIGLILTKLRALQGLIFSLLYLVGYFAGNLWLLFNERTWTSFVHVLGVILVNWFAIVLFKFFGEEKDKRFIKGAFQQYLSPKVIDQLVNDPGLLKLGGEKREITAFFSDVQGFSTISESLTPEELVELLNEYLTAMTDIVMKYDGTVDKFEGDAVIAFFGAPVTYPDHAVRACLASLEMQQKLVEMRANWKQHDKHQLYVRIGLNTDQVVVGNMGSAYRMDYTMMGDGVNLAARLEGVNKQYGTYTLISEYTHNAAKDHIEVRELDMIRVVGKKAPVRIFEVLGKKGEVSAERLKAARYFSKGLQLYRAQNWHDAIKYFGHTNKLFKGDGASQVFVERCKKFMENQPAKNWDGVYQMASK